MVSEKWNIIIADEILGAIQGRLLPQEWVIKLIEDKPEEIDLVLTGRYASDLVIKLADLVTEMRKIKHPFDQGTRARRGIDY